MLKRIGLTPGKKLLIFLISLTALTIPMAYVYNSIAVILFVACSLLSARKTDFSIKFSIALPMALFLLMALSVSWSVNAHQSVKALGKEASLIFIPIAFMVNSRLSGRSVDAILKNYSLGMCVIGIGFLVRAFIRFAQTGNTEVFFYHELSTFDVNAIYLSVLFSMAFIIFLAKETKTFWGYGAMGFLLLFIFLLSSKNLIIINLLIVVLYYTAYSGFSRKVKTASLLTFLVLFLVFGYFGKIHERFMHELEVDQAITEQGVHVVTLKEAATRDKFDANCYFNGTAFRTYQARIFTEMLNEDGILLTGYGLSGSKQKIEQKGIEHNIYHESDALMPYNKMNFHNQYIEVFADLGIMGFVLVVLMLLVNLKNGIQSKYFVHIAFAILMISVFLTESFIWRQRGVVFFTLFYCIFNTMQPFAQRRAALKAAEV
ncbi:O-antigen ligase family protein [Flavobacterium sp. RHBU_3]|uniref:O-antigen ligase family protein n=1 Tax=Flavobacterium sp. RHBU_3 TaxID=3391184 RepID=UPI003985190E